MFTRLLHRIAAPLRADAAAWPGQCLICHAWPTTTLCGDCVARFAPAQARCTTCALPVPPGVTVCGQCLRKPPPMAQCLAAVDYRWPWSMCVARWKFEGDVGLTRPLATLLQSTPGVRAALDAADLVLPMPMSEQRLAERGHNPALLLARRLAPRTTRAGLLLRPHGRALSVGAAQLRFVLLAHGLFYLAKAGSAAAPDAFVNLASFRGAVILVSLVEGVMAIMLLAMSMTGTERHRREERIAQIAARDPLTALDNRRALYLRAPELLRQSSPASPGALLLIDIDHFKQVNDLHGHDAGDRLLVTLSDLIRGLLPHDALAARLGGDEFVILLRCVSGADAQALGQNLRESFAQQARAMFATPEPVSLSIGATLFDQPETELSHWLKRADEALYASKRKGRNRMELAPLPLGRPQ